MEFFVYAVFLMLLAAVAVMRMRVRKLPPWRWIALAVSMVVFFLAAWLGAKRAGESEDTRMRHSGSALLSTYAAELENLGHASLKADAAPDDPRFQSINEAGKRWLQANPRIRSLHTFRMDGDGTVRVVVACNATTVARSMIGKENREDHPALSAAFHGESLFADEPVTDQSGVWISGFHPLRDATGGIEGVVGMNMDASEWTAAIERSHTTTLLTYGLAGCMVMVLLTIAEMWVLVSENSEQRSLNATIRNERVRFETLVNSIDGIVWDGAVSDFRFSFVSKQSLRLLGYDPEECLADPGFRASIQHADDRWVDGHRRKLVDLGKPYEFEYRVIARDGRTVWIREAATILLDEKGQPTLLRGVLHDVTARKLAREEMERLNQDLLEVSRRAGMAEVATSVLHNVGNLLNSIGVAATVASDRIRSSRISGLRLAADMIRQHEADLAGFLSSDPKGRHLPEYLGIAVRQLAEDHEEIGGELDSLGRNIEHVKEIVSMQQNHANLSGVFELLDPVELMENALRMNGTSLARHQVEVLRDYRQPVPRVNVDRHKVLQILVNLIRNAKQAMEHLPYTERRIEFSIHPASSGDMVSLKVRDSGIGIESALLTEIFRHGFTTKEKGSGFGLHSAANLAREMGGMLSVHSEGPGRGAEFILSLVSVGDPVSAQTSNA